MSSSATHHQTRDDLREIAKAMEVQDWFKLNRQELLEAVTDQGFLPSVPRGVPSTIWPQQLSFQEVSGRFSLVLNAVLMSYGEHLETIRSTMVCWLALPSWFCPSS